MENSTDEPSIARDYVQMLLDYVERVAADKKGKIYGLYERLAAKRFDDDIERQKLATCAFYFDVDRFIDSCDFIEKLPHVKAFKADAITLHETQIFQLANIFGFRSKANPAVRRFTTVYVEVGRKNGKSTFAAAIALYCMCCENEVAPEILTAATTKDQAKIVLGIMKDMVKKTPDLRREFGFKVRAYELICDHQNGIAKAISADGGTQDGHNPHCSVVDELHAHKNREILDVIESADGARDNALLLMITTAGKNLIGVCYDERGILIKILTGVWGDKYDYYFGIIFTLDKDDDALDEKNWRKPNPLLGVSIDIEKMRQAALSAKASNQKLANFETKRMNVWRHSADVWLDMIKFKEGADPELMQKLMAHTEAGGFVEIGVDLSEVNDLTSVFITWYDANKELYWLGYHFLPEQTINNQEYKNYAQYQDWYKEGHLIKIDGGMIDLRVIKQFIIDLNAVLNVMEVVFDRAIGAVTTVAELDEEEGIETITMTKNVTNVSPAALHFEGHVNSGTFHHDGDPILAWMASNVFVTKGINGTILPKKEDKNSTNKIDGIDAGIHGTARLMARKPVSPIQSLGGVV